MNEKNQLARKDFTWWIGVIAMGTLFGIMAYLKTKS